MQDELTKKMAADLGISDFPEKDQQEIIAQFGEVALKATAVAVLGKLSEEKQKEFEALAKTGKSEDLKAFLDKEVPDNEAITRDAIAGEIRRFRESQPA